MGKEWHDLTDKEKIWNLLSRVEALEGKTHRPSEPKKLWEKLAETHRRTPHRDLERACKDDNHGMWKCVADSAKEWFVEIVKSTRGMSDNPGWVYRGELIKRIQETE